ncbi:MAG: ester cyclase [Solirubrobacteraceae bacterium]
MGEPSQAPESWPSWLVRMRSRREEIVFGHIRAERHRADLDAAVGAFADGRASYDVIPLRPILGTAEGAVTHPTPDEVHAHLAELTAGFPDLELVVHRLHHADAALTVEGVQIGTHSGAWNGLQPTGRRISVPAAVFYRFEDDQMVNETVYFDLATMMRQLGVAALTL